MTSLTLAVGPLTLFVFVASITPGPNNLMLMRSGARFGVRRSLRHLFGVQLGFAALVVLAFLGVGAVFLALPGASTALRWTCAAYLLWLAWQILREARTQPATAPQPAGRPMHLVEALLFQPLNPKAWMMATTVVSGFNGGSAPGGPDLAAAVLVCLILGGPCMLTWLAWGATIDRALTRPRLRQGFNLAMALLVLATALWMLRT